MIWSLKISFFLISIFNCFQGGYAIENPKRSSSSRKMYGDQPIPDDKIIPTSRCRQNYGVDMEASINKQVNLYFHAGYVYQSMASYFGNCDVALPGFKKFFNHMANSQKDKSDSLISYQSLRGGNLILQDVSEPNTYNWGSSIEAMNHALQIEKKINQVLLDTYKTATKDGDSHAANFIMTTFIAPQVESIFKLSSYITNLERAGPGLGEFLFDKLPQN